MKILNLYACIGGNRKLWGDEHEITAVELDPKIAEIYQDYFPNDTVIVGDAHQYLLDHFNEFDFIWSSPPCPSHSRLNTSISQDENKTQNRLKIQYPDMKLWQEIILLQQFFKKGMYCIENVIPYYKPMFGPQIIDRHCFWANFYIHEMPKEQSKHEMGVTEGLNLMGYDLSKYSGIDKRKTMRNCVWPKVGKHILDSATKNIQDKLF